MTRQTRNRKVKLLAGYRACSAQNVADAGTTADGLFVLPGRSVRADYPPMIGGR